MYLKILAFISLLGLAAIWSESAIAEDQMMWYKLGHGLSATDLVRTEEAAISRALSATRRTGNRYYGRVIELSRAHADGRDIRHGGWVWVVSIQDSMASDLWPVPNELVWVAAKDGVVVPLMPASQKLN